MTPIPKRYGALRFIANLFLFFAVIIIILGVLGAVATFMMSIDYDPATAIGGGFGLLFGSIISGVSLIAGANSIRVVLDIEENTRRAALLLEATLQQGQRKPKEY